MINTIASIWGKNVLRYLSANITCICPSKLTVFLELHIRSRKTVRFSEQIMSADKYSSQFSGRMEAIVYLFYTYDNYYYTIACLSKDSKAEK